MPAALIGVIAGLFVRNVPSLKRTMGQPILGVKQHRPKLAYVLSYAILIGMYAIPTYHSVIKGFDIAFYIVTTVLAGPLMFAAVNHCHAFYLQQTETGIYWRNWRWKTRYMPYETITEILLQNNGKNGYLRVRSSNIKHVRLSFDPWQFDASIMFAVILYRIDYKDWPQNLEAERLQELVAEYGPYEKMFGHIKRLAYEKKLELD